MFGDRESRTQATIPIKFKSISDGPFVQSAWHATSHTADSMQMGEDKEVTWETTSPDGAILTTRK